VYIYVISLFINVLFDFVIKSIEKRWDLISDNIRIDQFIKLIKFIMDSTYFIFIFNKVVHKQIFGTLMNPPLFHLLRILLCKI